jgi:hypothetical protein
MNNVVSDGARGRVSTRFSRIAITAVLAVSALSSFGCATGVYGPSAFGGKSAAIERPVEAEFRNREENPEKPPELFGAEGWHGNAELYIWPVIGEPTGISAAITSQSDEFSWGADVLIGIGWHGGRSLHLSTDLLMVWWVEGPALQIFVGPGVRYRTRDGNVAELGPRALFGASFFVITGSIAPGYDFKNMEPTLDFDVGLVFPF